MPTSNPHHFIAGSQSLTMTSNTAGNLGLVIRYEHEESVTASGVIVNGKVYKIATVGTTNFTLLGAADNNIGTEFTANSATPSGTGTVKVTKFYTITTQSGVNGTVGSWGHPAGATSGIVVNTMAVPAGSTSIQIDVPAPDNTLATFYVYHTALTGAGTNITLNTGSPTLASPMTFTSQLPVSATISTNTPTGFVLDSNYNQIATTITGRQGDVIHSDDNNTYRNTTAVTRSIYWRFNTSANADVSGASLVTGDNYIIKTVGTTDWTSVGASANTVGVKFKATGLDENTNGVATQDKRFTISRQPLNYDLGGVSGGYPVVGSNSIKGGTRIDLSATDAANIRVGMTVTDRGKNTNGDAHVIPAGTKVTVVSGGGTVTISQAITGDSYVAGDIIHFSNGWQMNSNLTASFASEPNGTVDKTTLLVSGTLTVNKIGTSSISGNAALNPGNFASVN